MASAGIPGLLAHPASTSAALPNRTVHHLVTRPFLAACSADPGARARGALSREVWTGGDAGVLEEFAGGTPDPERTGRCGRSARPVRRAGRESGPWPGR